MNRLIWLPNIKVDTPCYSFCLLTTIQCKIDTLRYIFALLPRKSRFYEYLQMPSIFPAVQIEVCMYVIGIFSNTVHLARSLATYV